MKASTFSDKKEAATPVMRDGLGIMSTTTTDFDDELLPNMPRQRNQR